MTDAVQISPGERRAWFLALVLVFAVYVLAFPCDVMDVDAAQYASISQQMIQDGGWLQIRNGNQNYLDKPPLTFWAAAASYTLFGISNFAYRFPSFLFTLLAVFSTGKLARLLYGERAGWMAALITASSQAFFTMNQDVKTDMYLAGSVMFATWQLTLFTRTGKILYLLPGGLGLSLGMLAKGPVGVIIPLMAIGGDLILSRHWKTLFSPKWLVMIPVFILPLIPFCLGLYHQFGWHGVKFFLWTQSFGRITGESEWANDTTPFFLVHNFAWAFLPWLLIFVPAFIFSLTAVIKNRFRTTGPQLAVGLCGFVLPFLALSMSRYKLPHYIYVVVPFAAILTAEKLSQFFSGENKLKKWLHAQNVLFAALTAALPFLLNFCFPGLHIGVIACIVAFSAAGIFAWIYLRQGALKFVLPLALFAAGINAGLNLWLYPNVLKYQSSVQAVRKMKEVNTGNIPYLTFIVGGHASDFYNGRWTNMIPGLRGPQDLPGGHAFIYTNEEGVKRIQDAFPGSIRQVWKFPQHRATALSVSFLNPSTRGKTISWRFLLEVKLRN